MEYLALYRQWRPRTFAEIVGQSSSVTGLLNAVKEGKLAHAYLFSGPRGTGKTSMARILARAVNCPNQAGGEPCNNCPTCEDILNGSFMDVIEIDAASNRGIEEIRDLREKVKLQPAQGKRKVYIIDEVHMLTPEAFNALLKTLEDPPESVIFILATTEAYRVPATVLSRCQRYAFSRLTPGEIEGRLYEVADGAGLELAREAAEIIAVQANGSLRDALSILDQCASYCGQVIEPAAVRGILGMVDRETLAKMVKALAENRYEQILLLIDSLTRQGREPGQITRDLSLCLRDLLLYKVLGAKVESMTLAPQALAEIADSFPALNAARLSRGVKMVMKLGIDLKYNEGQRFLLEAGLLEVADVLSGGGQTAPASSPTTDQIWKDIVDRVKAQRVTTQALLFPARLLELSETRVIVGYPPNFKFHLERMILPENMTLLKKVIREVTGRDLPIELVLLPDQGEESEIEKKAREIFGENKIEIED